MKQVRLGAGAGFAGDRLEPALALAQSGEIDYLIFECLAERTIALAQLAKLQDPLKGYDALLEKRMRLVLPACAAKRVKIITNMGAANPLEAAKRTALIVQELGLSLRVFAVLGDDVLAQSPPQENLISANAYLGAGGIVEALKAGADIIVTGRVCDPALFLAPLVYEFGWDFDDYEKLGQGTLAGHLLECAGQITGGYFADPPFKKVEGLENLGFPIGIVSQNGDVLITKLPNTGGLVSLATCKEQLLYEIENPARYYQADVVADFSNVTMHLLTPNRVMVKGATGFTKPNIFKVSQGFQEGFIGEGQISYQGEGATERAALAKEILLKRNFPAQEKLIELIGEGSSHVRLRFAARCKTKEQAELIGEEMEALYTCGPAGGGGVSKNTRPIIAIISSEIDPSKITMQIIEVKL
jgi:Acyclic terpene utilisation family protein AtuA